MSGRFLVFTSLISEFMKVTGTQKAASDQSNTPVRENVNYREQCSTQENTVFGPAHLTRLAFEQRDITSTLNDLCKRLLHNAADSAALLDLSLVLLIAGRREESLQAQSAALEISRTYVVMRGQHKTFRVLAFMAPGDLMSNTPVDFLLEDSGMSLVLYYVDEHSSSLEDVPDHDIAFMAISESTENAPVLRHMKHLLGNWHGPILNNHPEQILEMTRDAVANRFSDNAWVFAPLSRRLERTNIERAMRNKNSRLLLSPATDFPVIVRPVGTHAGEGMEKITDVKGLSAYFNTRKEQEFYICPFIDYRSTDQLFRKYRIAFIDGKAFPCHLAISNTWMVHYLNANMDKHLSRRMEEEQWFNNFDAFAERHCQAFATLQQVFPLDYFAVDCAIMTDDRLLVFEADVAMLVHNMDAPEIYPYKAAAMRRLSAAFQDLLRRRATTGQFAIRPQKSKTPTFMLT
jgi:hypothetical protein